MRRRRVIPVLALSTALLASSGASSSAAPSAGLGLRHPVVRTDGEDTNGPLDLRSLQLVHLGPRFDRLSFSTWGPVTNAELTPARRGNFAVGIDLNDVTPIHYEYWIYVDVVGGRLRAILVKRGSNRATSTPVARMSPSGFWVDVPWRAMGRPSSYRFALYSYDAAKACAPPHGPCVDKMPNRLPLILQDLTRPTATWAEPASLGPVVADSLGFPARFTVRDDRLGSGVRRWELQRRALGASTWANVATGTFASPTVSVPGRQGRAYRVRIVATDRAGNTSVSARRTIVFPIDDRNSGVTFSGAWTQSSAPLAYLGTTSSSSTVADSATLDFTGGSQVCALGMPVTTSAAASVTIDGVPQADDAAESPDTPDQGALLCYPVSGGADAAHELVLSVSGGPDAFVLDGFEIVP